MVYSRPAEAFAAEEKRSRRAAFVLSVAISIRYTDRLASLSVRLSQRETEDGMSSAQAIHTTEGIDRLL